MASRSDSGNETRGSSESDNSPTQTPTPTRELLHHHAHRDLHPYAREKQHPYQPQEVSQVALQPPPTSSSTSGPPSVRHSSGAHRITPTVRSTPIITSSVRSTPRGELLHQNDNHAHSHALPEVNAHRPAGAAFETHALVLFLHEANAHRPPRAEAAPQAAPEETPFVRHGVRRLGARGGAPGTPRLRPGSPEEQCGGGGLARAHLRGPGPVPGSSQTGARLWGPAAAHPWDTLGVARGPMGVVPALDDLPEGVIGFWRALGKDSESAYRPTKRNENLDLAPLFMHGLSGAAPTARPTALSLRPLQGCELF
nr:uncharacterized protein LOC113805972 [Penaeus vannamei]